MNALPARASDLGPSDDRADEMLDAIIDELQDDDDAREEVARMLAKDHGGWIGRMTIRCANDAQTLREVAHLQDIAKPYWFRLAKDRMNSIEESRHV